LLILDIALQYKFEDYQKQIQRNNKALNEQRTIYNESMSALEIKKRQSQVAQDIAKMGLKELSSPPIILESTDTLQVP
jgi:glycine/serine hydroxymethyltransferase